MTDRQLEARVRLACRKFIPLWVHDITPLVPPPKSSASWNRVYDAYPLVRDRLNWTHVREFCAQHHGVTRVKDFDQVLHEAWGECVAFISMNTPVQPNYALINLVATTITDVFLMHAPAVLQSASPTASVHTEIPVPTSSPRTGPSNASAAFVQGSSFVRGAPVTTPAARSTTPPHVSSELSFVSLQESQYRPPIESVPFL